MKQITKEEAQKLLEEYNKEDFHLIHAKTVSFVMGYFARKLGFEDQAEFWEIAGLLHDLDFEMYPDEHCIKSEEILRKNEIDEGIIHAVVSHGYGIANVSTKPEHVMEKILFAIDELTGLIWATALMRPSKSVLDLEVKSLKKKYKSTGFAAGCSREVIQKGADMLEWELDKLFEETIFAMREYEKSI